MLISAKKTHVFRKGTSFLRFLRKRRTLSEGGRHFCEFCENDARFPRVEFVYFLKIGGWAGGKGGVMGGFIQFILAGWRLAAWRLAGWLRAGWLGWTQEGRQHGPEVVVGSFLGPTVRHPDCHQQYSGLHQQDSETLRTAGLQDCQDCRTPR